MKRTEKNLNEGILITLLGILGIEKVIESFPMAGAMVTQMLYTLFFVFIAITIIGFIIILDEIGILR